MQCYMAEIKKALANALNLNETQAIQEDSRLKEDFGLDSMTSLTFLMELENNIPGFIVDPENLEMEDLDTVRSVAQYVNTQLVQA